MSRKINRLSIFLCILLCACQNKIEIIEEKDDTGQVIATYERRSDDFAKHGYFKGFHASGKLFEEAIYENNKLKGPRKMYYENGQLQAEELYVNGELEGIYKTYSNKGTLTGEGMYAKNTMLGIWKFYYPSGKLKEEVTFMENEENGPFKEFYENGKVKAEGDYENGPNEVGELKKYDEQGVHTETLDCELMTIGDDTFSKCSSTWKKE